MLSNVKFALIFATIVLLVQLLLAEDTNELDPRGNQEKFKCKREGKFSDPNDKTRYHFCFKKGGQLVHHYNACPGGECFSEPDGKCSRKACSENPRPYDCSSRSHHFSCRQEGVFADLRDASVYYHCKRRGDKWEVHCYTCNNAVSTCYSNFAKGCVAGWGTNECWGGDEDCQGFVSLGGTGRSAALMGSMDELTVRSLNGRVAANPPYCPKKNGTRGNETGGILTYNCNGYHSTSVPCHVLGRGQHRKPGDPSVYFTCSSASGVLTAECSTCDKGTCWDDKLKRCAPGCKGSHKPYDCSSFDSTSFTCTEEGFFVHPAQPSIFVQCRSNGVGKWSVDCRKCSSKWKTCFCNKKQSCIPCKNGTAGGDGGHGGAGGHGGHGGVGACGFPGGHGGAGGQGGQGGSGGKGTCGWPDGMDGLPGANGTDGQAGAAGGPCRFYDCGGYDSDSFPCHNFATNTLYPHAGDASLYFECVVKDGQLQAVCKSCSKQSLSCFNSKLQKCVENCGAGKPVAPPPPPPAGPNVPVLTRNSCKGYSNTAYPCTREGYFVHPKDPSIYFWCVHDSGRLHSICNRCPRGSCFVNKLQQCSAGCTGARTLNQFHDCNKYDKSLPIDCDFLKRRSGFLSTNFYGAIGDPTVYFRCKKSWGQWSFFCVPCPRPKCFNDKTKLCFSTCPS